MQSTFGQKYNVLRNTQNKQNLQCPGRTSYNGKKKSTNQITNETVSSPFINREDFKKEIEEKQQHIYKTIHEANQKVNTYNINVLQNSSNKQKAIAREVVSSTSNKIIKKQTNDVIMTKHDDALKKSCSSRKKETGLNKYNVKQDKVLKKKKNYQMLSKNGKLTSSTQNFDESVFKTRGITIEEFNSIISEMQINNETNKASKKINWTDDIDDIENELENCKSILGFKEFMENILSYLLFMYNDLVKEHANYLEQIQNFSKTDTLAENNYSSKISERKFLQKLKTTCDIVKQTFLTVTEKLIADNVEEIFAKNTNKRLESKHSILRIINELNNACNDIRKSQKVQIKESKTCNTENLEMTSNASELEESQVNNIIYPDTQCKTIEKEQIIINKLNDVREVTRKSSQIQVKESEICDNENVSDSVQLKESQLNNSVFDGEYFKYIHKDTKIMDNVLCASGIELITNTNGEPVEQGEGELRTEDEEASVQQANETFLENNGVKVQGKSKFNEHTAGVFISEESDDKLTKETYNILAFPEAEQDNGDDFFTKPSRNIQTQDIMTIHRQPNILQLTNYNRQVLEKLKTQYDNLKSEYTSLTVKTKGNTPEKTKEIIKYETKLSKAEILKQLNLIYESIKNDAQFIGKQLGCEHLKTIRIKETESKLENSKIIIFEQLKFLYDNLYIIYHPFHNRLTSAAVQVEHKNAYILDKQIDHIVQKPAKTSNLINQDIYTNIPVQFAIYHHSPSKINIMNTGIMKAKAVYQMLLQEYIQLKTKQISLTKPEPRLVELEKEKPCQNTSNKQIIENFKLEEVKKKIQGELRSNLEYLKSYYEKQLTESRVQWRRKFNHFHHYKNKIEQEMNNIDTKIKQQAGNNKKYLSDIKVKYENIKGEYWDLSSKTQNELQEELKNLEENYKQIALKIKKLDCKIRTLAHEMKTDDVQKENSKNQAEVTTIKHEIPNVNSEIKHNSVKLHEEMKSNEHKESTSVNFDNRKAYILSDHKNNKSIANIKEIGLKAKTNYTSKPFDVKNKFKEDDAKTTLKEKVKNKDTIFKPMNRQRELSMLSERKRNIKKLTNNCENNVKDNRNIYNKGLDNKTNSESRKKYATRYLFSTKQESMSKIKDPLTFKEVDSRKPSQSNVCTEKSRTLESANQRKVISYRYLQTKTPQNAKKENCDKITRTVENKIPKKTIKIQDIHNENETKANPTIFSNNYTDKDALIQKIKDQLKRLENDLEIIKSENSLKININKSYKSIQKIKRGISDIEQNLESEYQKAVDDDDSKSSNKEIEKVKMIPINSSSSEEIKARKYLQRHLSQLLNKFKSRELANESIKQPSLFNDLIVHNSNYDNYLKYNSRMSFEEDTNSNKLLTTDIKTELQKVDGLIQDYTDGIYNMSDDDFSTGYNSNNWISRPSKKFPFNIDPTCSNSLHNCGKVFTQSDHFFNSSRIQDYLDNCNLCISDKSLNLNLKVEDQKSSTDTVIKNAEHQLEKLEMKLNNLLRGKRMSGLLKSSEFCEHNDILENAEQQLNRLKKYKFSDETVFHWFNKNRDFNNLNMEYTNSRSSLIEDQILKLYSTYNKELEMELEQISKSKTENKERRKEENINSVEMVRSTTEVGSKQRKSRKHSNKIEASGDVILKHQQGNLTIVRLPNQNI